jgi:hypothetical protein
VRRLPALLGLQEQRLANRLAPLPGRMLNASAVLFTHRPADVSRRSMKCPGRSHELPAKSAAIAGAALGARRGTVVPASVSAYPQSEIHDGHDCSDRQHAEAAHQ